MKDLLDILNNFCSKEEIRPAMQKPCGIGKYVYATNGHAAVRMDNFANFPSVKKYPDIEGIFSQIKENCNIILDFSNLPEIETEPVYRLLEDERPCRECDGNGQHECECGNLHDCHACEGTGVIGEKKYSDEIIGSRPKQNQLIKIRDAYFNPELILFIAENFPMYGTIKSVNSRTACLIEFPNATVLIMPKFFDANFTVVEFPELTGEPK